MYAIIQTGGKQHKVKEGDMIDVELLGLEEGASVKFDVLMISDGKKIQIGEPTVKGYQVEGEIIGKSAGPKIKIVTYKRRKSTSRRVGHRQHYDRVKIIGIKGSKAKTSKAKSSKGAE
ncbi:MAG: 50S ribosomal protein L21 [Chlamydiae bacterium]|nr:50S ribosomal protein L21 [Chlamydiota bacterium]